MHRVREMIRLAGLNRCILPLFAVLPALHGAADPVTVPRTFTVWVAELPAREDPPCARAPFDVKALGTVVARELSRLQIAATDRASHETGSLDINLSLCGWKRACGYEYDLWLNPPDSWFREVAVVDANKIPHAFGCVAQRAVRQELEATARRLARELAPILRAGPIRP